jgi:hypothetical protein
MHGGKQEGQQTGDVMIESNGKTKGARGYAPVNGLKMYYEIEGTGDPLVSWASLIGQKDVRRNTNQVDIASVTVLPWKMHLISDSPNNH